MTTTSPTKPDAILDELVARLRHCQRLLFITGAGLSADSGLPTYRGIGGLYNDRHTDEELPIELALSGEMLFRQPAITWKYIAQIEAACRGADCNPAHRVIAALQDHFEVWVLTQNVDGLHRRAGSRNLIEIHGDIHELRCTHCPYQTRVSDYATLQIPPHCPDCGQLVRPRIVLFGEYLPEGPVAALYQQLGEGFDMVFSIGTTSVFPYIAAPVLEAARVGIPTVEINPGVTQVSNTVEYRIQHTAAASLQALETRWRTLSSG